MQHQYTFIKYLSRARWVASVILLLMVVFSCSKDITNRTADTQALQPANIDQDAGAWKPVLLTSPAEFAVAAPIAITNPDYIAQINEIKSTQANMTESDQQLLKYWSAGAVLRWRPSCGPVSRTRCGSALAVQTHSTR